MVLVVAVSSGGSGGGSSLGPAGRLAGWVAVRLWARQWFLACRPAGITSIPLLLLRAISVAIAPASRFLYYCNYDDDDDGCYHYFYYCYDRCC